jgi:cytochrome c oxidase assembly factor CtaG
LDLIALTVGILTIFGLALYVRGWMRLRRRGSGLATVYRLLVFVFAAFLVGVAFLSPLNTLNREYLFMRELQVVVVCLLAPPAYFISCAYDMMLAGLPTSARRSLNRTLQESAAIGGVLHKATPFWFVWLLFLSLFLIWHDPGFANWMLARPVVHTFGLVILATAALLFWWHLVGTGPRLHASLPAWIFALALVPVEIANMATGVSIAFADKPLYDHYAAAAAAATAAGVPRLNILEDQALGGAMLWVAGSFIYISAIILLVNRLFQAHDGTPEPHPNWDDDDRMIMPGLEHRVRQ